MKRFLFLWMVLPVLLMAACESPRPTLTPAPATASPLQAARAAINPPADPLGAIRFKNLRVDDGLSQSSARAILQDRQGFLWIGTEDGLNRYDGYQFKIYRPLPGNADSLSDRWISGLYEDRDGYMWVATRQGGLNRYDPATDQFTHYLHNPADPSSLSSDDVCCIVQDGDGSIWVGTMDGLDRLNPKTGAIQHFRHVENEDSSLSGNRIESLMVDKKGRLWVGTSAAGLNQFEPSTGKFRHYLYDPNLATSISGNEIVSIREAPNGDLWLGTYAAVSRLDPQIGQARRYSISPDSASSSTGVLSLFVDHTGNLWVGTNHGLDRLNEQTGKFTNYHHIPALPDSLDNNVILSIDEDREGVLWVGTYGGGINQYNPALDKFAFYRNDPENPNSLINNLVFGFHVDPSGITWIGTSDGLDRLDPSTGNYTHYRNDPTQPKSISANLVWSITRDSQGKLWIGTQDGLNQMDETANTFIRYQHDKKDPDSLADSDVLSVYEDQSNTLWLATRKGLDRFDRETGKFVHIIDPNDPLKTTLDSIATIKEDAQGRLWVGTFNQGLFYLDPDRKKFTYFQHDSKKAGSLSNNTVMSILQDHAGRLWFGSFNGLDSYDPAANSFTSFTEQDGLPNNVVYGVVEDKQGFLWLSTNFGISRFDSKARSFRNYTVNDGLQGNEFNQGAFAKSPGGSIYFGGVNGFNIFFPEHVQDSPASPSVTLTDLQVNGQPIQTTTTVSTLNAITLKWPQDSFEFDFSALSFAEPQNNQYAYKLDNFDKDWSLLGNKRSGRYTNLPGGTYTLRIKASNSDGVWNETGKAIRVSVIAPFWRTTWFYGLLGLALFGCVALIYRLRVRGIEMQKIELERLVGERAREIEKLFEQNKELAVMEERNRLARELHDSAKQKAFASLAQLGAASSLINQDTAASKKHIGEAENLVYEVIQELTFLIQEMYPAALKEKGLPNALREYIFEWETRTDIRVNLQIEGEGLLPLEMEQAVYRIAQELLANVARHSQASHVEFSVAYLAENVVVCISDNGQGFNLEQKPNGIGLRSVRERAKSIGASIEIKSAPGQGTQVTIKVPVQKYEKRSGGPNA